MQVAQSERSVKPLQIASKVRILLCPFDDFAVCPGGEGDDLKSFGRKRLARSNRVCGVITSDDAGYYLTEILIKVYALAYAFYFDLEVVKEWLIKLGMYICIQTLLTIKNI